MKTINYKRLFSRLAALALLPACFAVFSCKEDIDESNLYTFKGETIEDFLANRSDQFSNFNYILQRVGLDKRLSGYGTFTCFAPINEAVTAYVDSLYNDMSHEDLPHNGMTGPGLEGLTDSLCNDIAKFHIVDFKEYMAVDMSKNTTITTMLGRDLSTTIDTLSGNTRVNSDAQIINLDNELENGVLHILDHVITRSNNLVGGEMEKHPQFSIFNEALKVTGLVDSVAAQRKMRNGETIKYSVDQTYGFYVPEVCELGYTVFVETNEVMQKNGINNLSDLAAYANRMYAHCADPGSGWYDYARNHGIQVSTDNDYENPWNCLNMFIRYHIIKYKIPYDRLVYTGLNESGKDIGFYEYNETMLPFTLLKVYARTTTSDRQLNHWEANSSLNENDSTEVTKISVHHVLSDGLNVLTNNDYQQPLNGYIHRINGMLVYNEMVPSGLLNERLRFDDTALFHEMMSNNFRTATYNYIKALNGGRSGTDAGLGGDYIRIPTEFFDDMRIYNGENTRLYYLSGNDGSSNPWCNYQRDEFNCMGAYDFSMRLPPVPDGMYEIRMGYNGNGNRGMMQCFLGETNNVLQMKATDIPIDMRQIPSTGTPNDANIATGWKLYTDEADFGVQTDKNMHALGWMRAPLYFVRNGVLARAYVGSECPFRRIITRVNLKQGVYWLRFKTALPDNTSTQFHLDYIEIVPSSVYNNPMYLEDMY